MHGNFSKIESIMGEDVNFSVTRGKAHSVNSIMDKDFNVDTTYDRRVVGNTTTSYMTKFFIEDNGHHHNYDISQQIPLFDGADISVYSIDGIPVYYKNHSTNDEGYIADGKKFFFKKYMKVGFSAWLIMTLFWSFIMFIPLAVIFGFIADYAGLLETPKADDLGITIVGTLAVVLGGIKAAKSNKKRNTQVSPFFSALERLIKDHHKSGEAVH